MTLQEFQRSIREGIPETLPPSAAHDPLVNHAPRRVDLLTAAEKRLAVRNALRYFHPRHHAVLAPEFAGELERHGRVYMYRFRPPYPMHARPVGDYPCRSLQAAAIMLMIQNNLDDRVAQHPRELITYGGNGAVFQNWAQYRLTMRYLSEMTDEQTLVLYSGHPLGLFPSGVEAPRVVVTNGMVVPNHSRPDDLERFNALGVSQYGQMTAGSFMYIGPQGIVHGTTITLLNAGRKISRGGEGLAGKLFLSAGLGGMSGAQPKAGNIAGCVSVIAEVNPRATRTRLEQGWVDEVIDDLDRLVDRVRQARARGEAVSIAYQGNVVELWERFAAGDVPVEIGSDQTSLHNPWAGGYYPAGLSFDEANRLMVDDPPRFKELVRASLRRHVTAIDACARRFGTYFFDYGNAFLLEASRAGADVLLPGGAFKYPSYVEDIMGPLCFDRGFGPFRWVCASGDPADLERTDAIAARVIEGMIPAATAGTRQQLEDNLRWINSAGENRLVVGSLARILYADAAGRVGIAAAFNDAIARGELSAPVILGRDHHDVSGTDSPYRETANIRDGSRFTADMAVQNVIGDAFRGATWVSLHNGGGVGWGEVINGGFGMLLDGSEACRRRLRAMLAWDVNNGVARRGWARNEAAIETARRAMHDDPLLRVTLPHLADDALLDSLF
jgi:urocanate hydratase